MFHVKTYYLLFLLLLNSTFSFCQPTDTSEQKIELFPNSYGEKKWKILLGLDARRSFFAGEKVKINGLKLGADYMGVHKFGVGFYWLNKNLVFNNSPVGYPDEATEQETRFDLGYSSIFYERVFLKTTRWEVSIPISLGGGRIIGTYKDTLGTFQPFLEKPFSALIPAVQVKFYPLTWMALKTGGGYRMTFNTDKEVKQTFNTLFYGFGVGINPIELYKAIFKKETNKKKYSNIDKTEDEKNEIR